MIPEVCAAVLAVAVRGADAAASCAQSGPARHTYTLQSYAEAEYFKQKDKLSIGAKFFYKSGN